MKSFKVSIIILLVGVGITGCQNGNGISFFEASALSSSTLGGGSSAGNPSTDVNTNSTDSITPNLAVSDAINGTAVSNCDRYLADGTDRYEQERAAALAAAAADPTLIPVRYSISAGSKVDQIAYWSHQRSILRSDTEGVTPIYVGGPVDSDACNWTLDCNSTLTITDHLHYLTDHTQARADFIQGKKCFFDTVHVIASVDQYGKQTILNGQTTPVLDILSLQDHSLRNIYYGQTYNGADQESESPRLFAPLGSGTPNIVTLFLADVRGDIYNQNAKSVYQVLSQEFITTTNSLARGSELDLDFRHIFDLRYVFNLRDSITEILSMRRSIQPTTGVTTLAGSCNSIDYCYSAYEGVPQLLEWIFHSGANGIAMSTKYTPLVLDLGQKNILTSSMAGGTFFNLANLQVDGDNDDMDGKQKVSHLTAWIGGALTATQDSNTINKNDYKRISDDGFLVIPNSDGSITSSKNLFGSNMSVTINGVAQTFDNGFLALAALAKKDCTSSDIKQRYFGPWDGDLFNKTVKVWVDKNRNGFADPGEVTTLADAGVAAINTCYVVQKDEVDQFGNSTSMRAAFLYLDAGETLANITQDELVSRLNTGYKSDGTVVDFRVIIDIYFQSNPNLILEAVDPSRITQPSAPNRSMASIH